MSGFRMLSALAVASLGWSGAVHAVGLTGSVKEEGGKPVAGAMVKVTSASAAAYVTKVFTGPDGTYTVPDLGRNVQPKSMFVDVFRLGYERVSPASTALTELAPTTRNGVARVDFVLRQTSNIASQVPASAWLQLAPPSAERDQTILTCTQCHQLPNERTKRFATGLAGLDESQREQAWRGMVHAMRVAFYGALQAEHATPLTSEQLEELAKPENNFIDRKDEDVVAPWLAKHMPTGFDSYDAAKKTSFAAAPLGVNGKTLIREYLYPEKSFVRESAVLNGRVWVCDIGRNRIGQLDPDTGAYKWYDVPAAGAPAPHTMVLDADGHIWLTLLGGTGEMAAMFDPKTEAWRIYGGFPKGMAAHDFSQGPNYVMGFDKNDMNWMTIITHNKTIGFSRSTGEVSPAYDLPLPEGETPVHIAAYGGAMTSDQHFWFAQYNGVLGRFNTETRKVDHQIKYPYGAGPHRMVVGDDDMIYVGLLGSGQISIVDGRTRKEVRRVDLPDRASAPYALAWDPVRKAVWTGVTNNDSLFKYDIRSGAITEYPIGIKDLHARMIAIDHRNGDLWVTNSPIPTDDAEMRRVFLLRPGDR